MAQAEQPHAIQADLGDEAADLSEIQVEAEKPLIETVGATVEEGLELLSKVGLNDAFLFLRTYNQLSEGQRYRSRIAKLIEGGAQWWLMDEFCACLDRDTAKIIAFNLQKIARQQGKAVIVATTHSDLFVDLSPSVHVHKRFDEEIQIKYFPNNPTPQCSLISEMEISEGSMADWRNLCVFHYRGHRPSVPCKIFKLTRNAELCGVIVYSYPPIACYGRRQVLERMRIQQLNRQLSIISRVVIHPKYRTIGLGSKLIRETLPLAGTPCVELIAVMAKYSPFAEKVGMTKIAQQKGVSSVAKVTAVLSLLGFDLQLLGSGRYVKEKLDALTFAQVANLKDVFIKNPHPRFKRALPLGTDKSKSNAVYALSVQEADLSKVAKLIKLVSVLSQTKVYLFWASQRIEGNQDIA